MQQDNRFSDNTFLQNLGFETIRNALGYIFTGSRYIFLRYCIFGGVLGSFWVMAVIEPQGSLLWNLLPALLLAVPLAMLSDYRTTWEKIFCGILLASIITGSTGYLIHFYFEHKEHSGQIIFPALLSFVLWMWCAHQIFRKRGRRGLKERSGGVIRVLWVIGVLYLPILLSVIFYYRFAHRQQLESSASILFCVLAFVVCLTLALLRIFWIDGLRNYRAMRVGEYPNEDGANLLELLIPRSMFLVVMVPCLLFSEAMMFSVVYRVTTLGEMRRAVQKTPAPPRKASPATPETPSATPATPASSASPTPRTSPPRRRPQTAEASRRAPPSRANTQPSTVGYHFFAWLNFSIRPYVFPKHSDGTEVNAPAWIKPFGRILLSLIVLLLVTYQLNIWTRYKNCYITLYNLARKGAGTPEAPPELARHWQEEELDIRALLNNYGGVWRWLIIFATASPTRWLTWKWFLDPGTAFLESVDRIYKHCKYNWHSAVLGGCAFLILVTLPFTILYKLTPAFWYCILPSLLAGLALLLSYNWYDPNPPQLRSWLLPWLFPTHLLMSLVFFFVALSVRDTHHASLQFLWYISLATVIIYPILYWFGGERLLPPSSSESEERAQMWKSSRQVRLAFLNQFFTSEHRSWVMDALIYRIHPVRSRTISARYVLPSVQLSFFQWLRERVRRLEDARQSILNSFHHALLSQLAITLVVAFFVVVFVSLNTSEQAATVFLQMGYGLFGALLPTGILWGINELTHRLRRKPVEDYPLTPRRLMVVLSALTLSTTFLTLRLFQITTPLPVLVFLLVGFMVSFPWLGFASWRYLLRQHQKKAEEQVNASKAERPSRLGRWIDVLQRKEDDALSLVYRRVHRWGRTEQYMRHEMCKGLTTLIQSTQLSLSTERWFREEKQDLDRVTNLWLGEGDITKPDNLTKPAKLLASLFLRAIDVLGSVLYDQTHPERRKMLAPHQPPDTKIVLRTLEGILRLSLPPLYKPDHRGRPPAILEDLYHAIGDLEDLVVSLVRNSASPNSDVLDADLCRRHRTDLLRIVRLLNPSKCEKLLRSHATASASAHPHTPLPQSEATAAAPANGDVAQSFVSSAWERTETLLRLPTPLARLYQEIDDTREQMEDRIASQDELYIAPMHLRREQAHHVLQEHRQSWTVQHELADHRQSLWTLQRQLYQELLGYLLAGQKSYLPFVPSNAERLNLHWQSHEERRAAYDYLSTHHFGVPEVDEWARLYCEAYDDALSTHLSQHEADAASQDRALEHLERILLRTSQQLSQQAELSLTQDFFLPLSNQENLTIPVRVTFRGACPNVTFVQRSKSREAPMSPLMEHGALLWTGKQAREFRRLEIWNARWLLGLLYQASRSWEMWVPTETHQNPLEYRQHNLTKLKNVIENLGALLPMPAREDQEEIDVLFGKLDRRVALLERNLSKPQEETPLETSLPFGSAVQAVETKLSEMRLLGQMRMAQLLHAGLLPHNTFQYLTDVIFANGETLLRYQDGSGDHGTTLPMKQGEPVPTDLAARTPWPQAVVSLPLPHHQPPQASELEPWSSDVLPPPTTPREGVS